MHAEKKPHRDALRLVARIWARESTGVLQSSAGRAVIVGGEPRDEVSLEALIGTVYTTDARFTFHDVIAKKGLPVADHLWEVASRKANSSAIRQRLDHALVERPGARGIGRLPLSEGTRQVLAQENSPRHTLGDLIDGAKADTGNVCHEISILIVLGLCKLRQAASRGTSTPAPKPAPAHDQKAPARRSSRRDERVIQRLQLEWSVIEKADDYTVIGISPDMSDEIVQRACERMLRRYTKLSHDERLPPEAKELVVQIHKRIANAVLRLQQGCGLQRTNPSAEVDPFEAGLVFADQDDWTRAVKCFNMARHRDPNNGRNVAWLAWAVFNDPSFPEEKRLKKAQDLMGLAESLTAGSPAIIKLAARLDYALGDLVRAWNRLDLLATRNPDDAEIRELLIKVQQDIKHRK